MADTVRSPGQQCSLKRREADIAEQIRQALKAVNLMKMLEGKQAIGNQSNNKIIGEHKVRFLSFLLDSLLPSDVSRRYCVVESIRQIDLAKALYPHLDPSPISLSGTLAAAAAKADQAVLENPTRPSNPSIRINIPLPRPRPARIILCRFILLPFHLFSRLHLGPTRRARRPHRPAQNTRRRTPDARRSARRV